MSDDSAFFVLGGELRREAEEIFRRGERHFGGDRLAGQDSAEDCWKTAAELGLRSLDDVDPPGPPPEITVKAWFKLGILRDEQNRLKGDDSAEHWWRLAAGKGDSYLSDETIPDRPLSGRRGGVVETMDVAAWRLCAEVSLVESTEHRGHKHVSGEYGWLHKARQGGLEAMVKLGDARRAQGRLCGDDSALYWWQAAADAGNDEATSRLKDLAAEENRLVAAAGEGSASAPAMAAAMVDLGRLRHAQGQWEGDDSAEYWWKQAAGSGEIAAMVMLGNIRYRQQRREGVDSADHWWRSAAGGSWSSFTVEVVHEPAAEPSDLHDGIMQGTTHGKHQTALPPPADDFFERILLDDDPEGG